MATEQSEGLCDKVPDGVPNVGPLAPCAIHDLVEPVVDFAGNPWGATATLLQDAVSGLTEAVLPAIQKLTAPDLSAEWFVDAYRITFALALVVFFFLLLWNFVQLSRRQVSGDDVVESVAFYAPMFIVGVMLGPLLGQMLVRATQATGQALADALLGASMADITANLVRISESVNAGGGIEEEATIAGGVMVGLLMLAALCVALVFVLLIFVVQLVTLYLTGVLVPLSLVWLTHPRLRSKGLRVVTVWVGVLASQVLLVLMLGVAFRMSAGLATAWEGKPGLKILIDCVIALVAIVTACVTPFALMRFGASVMPTTAPPRTAGAPAGRGSGRGGGSQLGQLSQANGSRTSTVGAGGDTAAGRGVGGGVPGGLSQMAGMSSSGAGSGAGGAAGGGSGPRGGVSGGGPGPQAAGSIGGAGAGRFAGTVAGGASVGGGGAAAGTSAAAGGAAATGVGLPVAAAVGAAHGAKKLATLTAALAQQSGDLAATEARHEQDHELPRHSRRG